MNVPPLVDIGPLMSASHGSPVSPARRQVSDALNEACGTWGFFRITGHGIDPALLRNLDAQARNFFARSDEEKSQVAMAKAGSAWRGWFPVGAELTSGRPDRKEGLYIGTELPSDDPRVLAQLPLHGPNLFPDHPDGLGPAAIDWMEAVTEVGHAIMSGLAIALGLDPHWFATHLTADPTVLFRIFRYPPDTRPPDGPAPATDADAHPNAATPPAWGVAEHTDYGLLTLLAQDDSGGLEVRVADGWVKVPAEPGVMVCNLGDMLEAITAGRYRSTLHRVRNTSGRSRLSFPLFFDPSWDAQVRPLPITADDPATPPTTSARWDGADPAAWSGTYGQYLTAKVARVFPELFSSVGP
ncbi:MAG: 2-oxoglutarate and iron-dependent oxygenase domain-containing protein [Candidatus Microthrix parvicella]|uniref:isopenicillin N synthase family dioxygenase n=1 Tax=Candidatus Neomicrothrix sp. TaxID=2719034 RepID=UPI000E8E0BB9|nr:2-oxoglutarate and iron-dependent oxygenase domain-containing protein [Candidatus Microthrix sp.]HBX10046.1 isopenicillin N synthase family oxygenase [Candidatus Microthrix parvicella]MBK6503322.1 isopenicillin N synthase family oxygenase [Candidatus Microthrix sp.]MBK7323417.1 isopenicillin N synthase family oxygenase [Candidatus Microthrix sp.]MBP6150303.1 isopenicillin N synthase family oxygenase [Candidatus Microthrix sp.]MBP7851561.1 isopenicillin N synthase family oxygenase [Candidatu